LLKRRRCGRTDPVRYVERADVATTRYAVRPVRWWSADFTKMRL